MPSAAAALLALAGGALYAPVRHHEFVEVDDGAYIVDNPVVRAGLTAEGVAWAFTTVHAANWHPLTWLSHMLDCELFGVDPGAHHLVSAGLHGTNAALLFLGLWLMTRAPWPSLFAAALFGAHPLRVESVAWAAERKDVLAGLLWMGTLLAYAHYARRPGIRRYLLVIATFVLGLMAKPMLVTLPLVLLLVDCWPLGRWQPWRSGEPPTETVPLRRLIAEKLPLLTLSAASAVITWVAQESGGTAPSIDRLPAGARVGNALVSYVAYLGMSIWPSGLAYFYPHPAAVPGGGSGTLAVRALASVVLLGVLTLFALLGARRRPYLATGWLWYLGMLVPVIGLVQVGSQARADRYTYLPAIGLSVIVAWSVAELAERGRVWKLATTALALGAVLGLAAATRLQLGYWKDSRSLFERAVAVTEGNFAALTGLGNLYLAEGDLPRAIRHYGAAILARPNFAIAHSNLGVAYARTGDLEQAAAHYREALRIEPENAGAHTNLGNVLLRRCDLDGAAAHYEEALRIDPTNAAAHNNLGSAHARRGDLEQAAASFERALTLELNYPDARSNLALVATRLAAARAGAGELEAAISWQEKAVRHAPRERLAELEARLEDYRSAAARAGGRGR
jgi:tetratricopeptide (TPR) repeat protein